MNILGAMVAATRLHQNGRFEQAEQIYRQVLAIQPRNPDALHLLGLIEHQFGRNTEAQELIERAIRNKPHEPTFYVNLGQVYRALNRIDMAEQAQRQAIELDPNIAEAHSNLASILRERRQLEQAETSVRRALNLNPRFPAALINLGNILKDRGQIDQAIESFQQALNFGASRPEILNNIGDALRAKGEYAEARTALEEAINLAPDMAVAHWNLSLLHLLAGDLPRGFEEYEWRLRLIDADSSRFNKHMWDGGELNGQTILLHAEQGFGDAIQFIRYAPLVAQRGGKIIVECQRTLVKLLRSAPDVSAVFGKGEKLPEFDCHVPMLSLPRIFNTTLESIPATVPYLSVDEQLTSQWQSRLPNEAGIRKIGLVWQGNPKHINNRNRSLSPTNFQPLINLPGVKCFSLQIGGAPVHNVTDLASDLRDFADTAAALNELDLLITVDTAATHVAGAMGRPVWLLLPLIPDWRWLLDRADSPWYPTMRIFRQAKVGDWSDVMDQIMQALADHSMPMDLNQSGRI
ncbi:MAG TPA: tetratricopeptide repeat protein [Tepidisphaeraceae bacterium]|nr:tetratricopeptide repeat protein [Tepidisphaeraceae bacterium]